MNVLNGQIDPAEMRKLGLTTASASAASGGLFGLSGASASASAGAFARSNNPDAYTFRHPGSTQYGSLGRYGSSGSAVGYSSSSSLGGYGNSGSLGGYGSSSSVGYGYGSSGSVGGYSSTGYNAGYGSGYAGYDGYAGYAGSQVGTMGQLHPKMSSYGLYGNKFRTLSNEFTQGSTGSYRSNCDDFDNSGTFFKIYSYQIKLK